MAWAVHVTVGNDPDRDILCHASSYERLALVHDHKVLSLANLSNAHLQPDRRPFDTPSLSSPPAWFDRGIRQAYPSYTFMSAYPACGNDAGRGDHEYHEWSIEHGDQITVRACVENGELRPCGDGHDRVEVFRGEPWWDDKIPGYFAVYLCYGSLVGLALFLYSKRQNMPSRKAVS